MIYLVLFILFLEFYFNFLPLLKRKFKREGRLCFETLSELRPTVLKTAKSMLKSGKVLMSFSDEKSLYVQLSTVKNKLLNKDNSYQYFNFPRAWLMIGLLDEYESSMNSEILIDIESQCQKLLDEDGKLRFEFNKIDQSLFGVVFVRIYKLNNNSKYLTASNEIFQQIKKQFLLPNKDLILYRSNTEVCFVDTLGMVCPFLYTYADIVQDTEIISLANKQLSFYIDNAFDKDTNLPFHAFDLNNGLKLGPVNWTRGLGWFLIGISYAIRFHKKEAIGNQSYQDVFNSIMKRLESLKVNELYWPQFFGHSNDVSIDTSATLMILYSKMIASGELNEDHIKGVLKDSINKKGFIFNSSGDTFYINKYSRQKGYSEITQGLLVSILSKLN